MRKPYLKLRQPVFDGAGAQMLRIFSTYAISKNWNLDFTYDKLSSVYTQVFKHGDEIDLWNNFLEKALPNPQDVPSKFDFVVNHNRHHPSLLYSQIRSLNFLGFNCLHIIDSPQVIIKRFPKYLNCLQSLEGISHFRKPSKSDNLTIAIHIRQGEVSLSQFRSRHLPLSYFESILANISSLLMNECIDFTVNLYLEPNQEKTLDANDPLIKHSLSVDPDNPNLIAISQNQFRILNETPSQLKTPHLYFSTLNQSESAYETFIGLLNADIVIISKSSFSYLAGLLNSDSLVIYPEQWDPPLSTWISAEHVANFRFNFLRWVQTYFQN